MKRSPVRIIILVIGCQLLMPGFIKAQPVRTSAENPPLAQPLVREGDFAVQLLASLGIGTTDDETEAESTLGEVGIAPRNGWIADYPVTPDILGELKRTVSDAAASGKMSMSQDEAIKRLQDVAAEYGLSIWVDTSGQAPGDTSGLSYPAPDVIQDYYDTESPPVVTYYAPPPPYAYMYSWVPYPFWWWDVWFPGFYVLVDFHVRVHDHRGYRHGEFISNHFRDSRTSRIFRVDPAHRSEGGVFPFGRAAGWTSPAARSGAQSIMERGRATTTPGGAETAGREYRGYRGYGVSRSSPGTGSNAFEHSINRTTEQPASDRGFRSRSAAGQVSGGVSHGVSGYHGGGSRR
ncbi:MAG TPA: hypothetical protein VFG09_15065 [Thermodesulfovibrionales bacterium]|nr:hypothetical protein [Thermodesulfovibrionales bacterium]